MNDHEKYRELMAEALLGDIAPSDKDSLERHVAGCAACAAEYRALRLTLDAMAERERPEPGEEFWDGYWDRLSTRMESGSVVAEAPAAAEEPASGGREEEVAAVRRRRLEAAAGAVRPERRRPSWLPPFVFALPRWAWQSAAALVLVAIGVLIGRLMFAPAGPGREIASGRQPAAIIPASAGNAAAQALSYFDRSKVVILALVNYDPAKEDASALNLPLQQRISRRLVDEAGPLKEKLNGPRERRLRELVSDLETILVQIANLESGRDLEAVEFVKQAVAVRGVLLKINLSEMDHHQRPGTTKSSA